MLSILSDRLISLPQMLSFFYPCLGVTDIDVAGAKFSLGKEFENLTELCRVEFKALSKVFSLL